MRTFLFLCVALLWQLSVSAQSVADFLKTLPNAEVRTVALPGGNYKEAYLIMLQQPVDHKNPAAGVFRQRIWLSHIDAKEPVVLVTEGYTASRNYISELAYLLGANQLVVEHRYFEASMPEKADLRYLTVEQSANDHHRIVELFKPFYQGKWANTGISKGGSTTYFHRAFFPGDVDLSVPYVAPLNFAREDKRLFDFFHQVHTAEARSKTRAFQREVLKRREALLPKMREVAQENGMSFRHGFEKAFELSVLEYPFAFWQWGHELAYIPDTTASDDVLFEHLRVCSDFDYVSDSGADAMRSFFYQAYTELGYYAYTPSELKPLMKGWERDTISSDVLLAGADTLRFRPETMHYVMQQLRQHNPPMVIITGENDPWGATSLQSADLSRTLHVVKPEGSHTTRIGNLPPVQRAQVYAALQRWMGVPVPRR